MLGGGGRSQPPYAVGKDPGGQAGRGVVMLTHSPLGPNLSPGPHVGIEGG